MWNQLKKLSLCIWFSKWESLPVPFLFVFCVLWRSLFLKWSLRTSGEDHLVSLHSKVGPCPIRMRKFIMSTMPLLSVYQRNYPANPVNVTHFFFLSPNAWLLLSGTQTPHFQLTVGYSNKQRWSEKLTFSIKTALKKPGDEPKCMYSLLEERRSRVSWAWVMFELLRRKVMETVETSALCC